jgi:hypothetical protein
MSTSDRVMIWSTRQCGTVLRVRGEMVDILLDFGGVITVPIKEVVQVHC